MSSSAAGPHDRRHPDPLSMTAAEKAICEWEARHDVAARGSRATPGPVQHYLAESRSRERCDDAARPRPAGAGAGPRRGPVPRPVRPDTEELFFRLAPPERPGRT